MKYKELLEKLQGLSEEQLNKDVVFWAEEEAFKVGFNVLDKPMYYDEEYNEDGCFEIEDGSNPDWFKVAYEVGYPILHERKNKREMKNQVLSIEQMRHLVNLGVETGRASMCWVKNTDVSEEESKYILSVHNEWCYEMACLRPIPTFTLQDIIELLPFDVFGSYNFWLMKAKGGYKFSVKNNPDSAKIGTHFYDSPLEAAYDILCWYLKKGK